MSASLVGSEMCIRDSSKGMTLNFLGANLLKAFCAENGMPEYTGSYGTVSYTHLTLPTICSV
eukprot:13574137-Alexandrium_andersonii.AAC.1